MSAKLVKNWDKRRTASISKRGNAFCRKHVRNVVRNLAELCPNHVRNSVRNFAEVCRESFYNSSEQRRRRQTFLGQNLGQDLEQMRTLFLTGTLLGVSVFFCHCGRACSSRVERLATRTYARVAFLIVALKRPDLFAFSV